MMIAAIATPGLGPEWVEVQREAAGRRDVYCMALDLLGAAFGFDGNPFPQLAWRGMTVREAGGGTPASWLVAWEATAYEVVTPLVVQFMEQSGMSQDEKAEVLAGFLADLPRMPLRKQGWSL